MGRLIALILALIVGVAIAWRAERTPEPKPPTAPATEFSAIRAMSDVEAMARAPHPIGSPENAQVRDHLLRRMAELGLSPQVRPGVGVQQPKWNNMVVAGRVENVVGVLPGRDRSAPAVALMAHYDSVPGSPGAADDAAGAAAALEIVRAIKARGPPARDIMLVMTDGEEAGLLGANHFFRRDPLSRRIGLVLNMEARGGGGRVQMFQTSPENGQLIDLLRRTAVRPSSSSLTVFVYEQMPNDTDLTETLAAGIPGMNYAFVGRQFDYHAASSTPANLEKGSLQDLGGQVLSLAAAAAFAPTLPTKAPSAVYSQVFGDLVIAYPPWAGWLILAASAVLIGVALHRARRAERFPWTDLLRGGGALVFAVLTAAVVLQFARSATGAATGFVEQRFLLAQVTRWEAAVVLIGLGVLLVAAAEIARGRRLVAILPPLAALGAAALGAPPPFALGAGVVAGVIAIFAFGRPVSRPAAWAGVLCAALVLAMAAQVAAPPAAYIVAWPLLAAAVAAAGTDFGARRGYASLALLALVAAISIGWLGNLAHGAFLSMDLMPLLALPVLLAALSLWPLAQPADGAPPERGLGAVLLIAGLLAAAWVRFADPYDARHPEAASVIYHADVDARRGFLVSGTPTTPEWTDAVLQNAGARLSHQHWHWRTPAPAAAVPYVDPARPEISLRPQPPGAVTLTAVSPGARAIVLRLRPTADLTLASVGGVATTATLKGGEFTAIHWAGGGPLELVLKGPASGTLDARVAGVMPGWPAGVQPLPPMPPDVMAWSLSGTTLVTASQRLTW